jgi:hypothetical protein
VLAVVLLTSPPDPDAVKSLAPFAAALRPAVLQVALRVEVLDPREDEHIAGAGEGFAAELLELQTRYQALRRAPSLADCQLFPPRRLIDDWLASNREYRCQLEARLTVDQVHAEALRSAIHETEQLHELWNLLRDAQCEGYYVTVRRRSLLELRDRIGVEAYCRGQMPPHLPVWHFPAWR